MRYRGVQRDIQRAAARRADRETNQRRESANPSELNDSDLTGAVYALQTLNRDGRYSARIRELVAEKARRREVSS